VDRERPFQFADGRVINICVGGGYFLYYSPDYEVANKPSSGYQSLDGKAYDFELHVTDRLRDGENALELENGQRHGFIIVKVRRVRLEFRKLRPQSRRRAGQAGIKWIAPPGPRKLDYKLSVRSGGGMVLTFGGRTWRIESRFSYPGGWNYLSPAEKPAKCGASFRLYKPAAGRGVIRLWAEGKFWCLQRTIYQRNGLVEVADALQNKTIQDIPVLIEHVALAPIRQKERVVIGGLEVPIKTAGRWTQANPTTLIAKGRSGVMLMPVDDVLRVHANNYATSTEAGFRDHCHVLHAKARRQLRWWIVPAPDGDYWRAINAARRAANQFLPRRKLHLRNA